MVSTRSRVALVALANITLVISLYLLIILKLELLALLLILISKWQILLGHPRLWLSNLKANGCDLIVGLCYVIVASLPLVSLDTNFRYWYVGLASLGYLIWMLLIKPQASANWVALQALICQIAGVSVIFLYARFVGDIAFIEGAGVWLESLLTIGASWLVAYVAASHFFTAQADQARPIIVMIWALLMAELAWILSRWLILYTPLTPLAHFNLAIPQASLIVATLAYFMGNLYLDHAKRRLGRRRLGEYILLLFFLLAIILLGTEWSINR